MVKLECTNCGAEGTGSCECGAPYVTKKQKMLEMVRTSPHLSNYVIAKESGVSRQTVQRARFETSPVDSPIMSDAELNSLEPGKPIFRTGQDGKEYRAFVKELRAERLSPMSEGEKLCTDINNAFNRIKSKVYKQLSLMDETDKNIVMEKMLEIATEFRLLAQTLVKTNSAHEEEDVEVD